MEELFLAPRYVTKGVNDVLDIKMQLKLWAMIDELRDTEIKVDYLQIFELSVVYKNGLALQRVIHRQESPEFIGCYSFPISESPMNMTVWAIDSNDYCTMLLPNEY